MQAARDALAALHGDPTAARRAGAGAKAADESEADATPSLPLEHVEVTVLDSLVQPHPPQPILCRHAL